MTPEQIERLVSDIDKIKRARAATSSILGATYAYDIICRIIDIVRVQHAAIQELHRVYYHGDFQAEFKPALQKSAEALCLSAPILNLNQQEKTNETF